jgi:hypothetical protein
LLFHISGFGGKEKKKPPRPSLPSPKELEKRKGMERAPPVLKKPRAGVGAPIEAGLKGLERPAEEQPKGTIKTLETRGRWSDMVEEDLEGREEESALGWLDVGAARQDLEELMVEKQALAEELRAKTAEKEARGRPA